MVTMESTKGHKEAGWLTIIMLIDADDEDDQDGDDYGFHCLGGTGADMEFK